MKNNGLALMIIVLVGYMQALLGGEGLIGAARDTTILNSLIDYERKYLLTCSEIAESPMEDTQDHGGHSMSPVLRGCNTIYALSLSKLDGSKGRLLWVRYDTLDRKANPQPIVSGAIVAFNGLGDIGAVICNSSATRASFIISRFEDTAGLNGPIINPYPLVFPKEKDRSKWPKSSGKTFRTDGVLVSGRGVAWICADVKKNILSICSGGSFGESEPLRLWDFDIDKLTLSEVGKDMSVNAKFEPPPEMVDNAPASK